MIKHCPENIHLLGPQSFTLCITCNCSINSMSRVFLAEMWLIEFDQCKFDHWFYLRTWQQQWETGTILIVEKLTMQPACVSRSCGPIRCRGLGGAAHRRGQICKCTSIWGPTVHTREPKVLLSVLGAWPSNWVQWKYWMVNYGTSWIQNKIHII